MQDRVAGFDSLSFHQPVWLSGESSSLSRRRSRVRVPSLARSSTSSSVAEHLPYKEMCGGSSPSGCTLAEAEEVEAPGRGPGGSGFESRPSPHPHDTFLSDHPVSPTGQGNGLRSRPVQVRVLPRGLQHDHAALAQLGEAPPSEGGGSGFDSPERHHTLHHVLHLAGDPSTADPSPALRRRDALFDSG